MSLFTLQSRCTNSTKHPLHRPSVDQTVKFKEPPIHRLLPRIPFPVPLVQPPPVEMEHVSTTPDTATTGSFGSPWTLCLGDLDEYGAGADCPLINHQINERSAKKPLLPLPDSPASLYRCKAQSGWRNHPKSPTRIRSERARHHAPSHYVDPQNKKLWPHTHPK